MYMLSRFEHSVTFPVRVIRVDTKPHPRTGGLLVSATALVKLSSEGEPITVELTGVDPEDIGTTIKVEDEFVERRFDFDAIVQEDTLHDARIGLKIVWFAKPSDKRIGRTCFFVDKPGEAFA